MLWNATIRLPGVDLQDEEENAGSSTFFIATLLTIVVVIKGARSRYFNFVNY